LEEVVTPTVKRIGQKRSQLLGQLMPKPKIKELEGHWKHTIGCKNYYIRQFIDLLLRE
jgi:hypothetical protein